jgi:endonuclease YncB( thermonuclease family)
MLQQLATRRALMKADHVVLRTDGSEQGGRSALRGSMKRLPGMFAASLLLALLFGFSCNAATITGQVVGVADGDTITVLDADKVQHKIRLAGIDAPEKKQPFGNRSKESLSDMVFDKTVNVETEKRDRYGRQIGKVLVNGQDVNLVQVERGMAWFYRQYQREQSPNDRKLYEGAEDSAKAARRGLWRDVDPVPPWDFRHNKTKS